MQQKCCWMRLNWFLHHGLQQIIRQICSPSPIPPIVHQACLNCGRWGPPLIIGCLWICVELQHTSPSEHTASPELTLCTAEVNKGNTCIVCNLFWVVMLIWSCVLSSARVSNFHGGRSHRYLHAFHVCVVPWTLGCTPLWCSEIQRPVPCEKSCTASWKSVTTWLVCSYCYALKA